MMVVRTGGRFERFRSGIALILGCAWAGSLWTIGFVVAPSLFAVLGPEHQKLAGDLAGGFFRFEMMFSVGCAVGLLILRFEGRYWRSKTTLWISGMLLMAALAWVWVIPVVTALRAERLVDPSVASYFARWHAASSVLYAAISVSAVPMVLGLAVDFGRILQRKPPVQNPSL